MSTLGQMRKNRSLGQQSVVSRQADIDPQREIVRFVPISEMGLALAACTESPGSIDTSGGSVGGCNVRAGLDSTFLARQKPGKVKPQLRFRS